MTTTTSDDGRLRLQDAARLLPAASPHAAEVELARKEDVEMEEFSVHRFGEIGEEYES